VPADEITVTARTWRDSVIGRSNVSTTIRLGWLLPILCYLVTIHPGNASIASLDKKWNTKDVLTACFFGGEDDSRETVAELANQWTIGTDIKFDFGQARSRYDCASKPIADIRIGFNKPGYWAYLGTDAIAAPKNAPTLNLYAMDEEVTGTAARMQVLHQFGHALGFMHQEQDPDSHCREELDPQKLRQELAGFTPDELERVVAIPNNGRYIVTGFDRLSVMRFFLSPNVLALIA
jgi:hypothetical protein